MKGTLKVTMEGTKEYGVKPHVNVYLHLIADLSQMIRTRLRFLDRSLVLGRRCQATQWLPRNTLDNLTGMNPTSLAVWDYPNSR